MQKRNRQLTTLMAQHGYILVREKRHAVWRHRHTGHQLVTSQTPSDWRQLKNVLTLVQRRGWR
jgi:hypothetical protein